MSAPQPSQAMTPNTTTPQQAKRQETAHHVGNYLDVPAILGSFLMLLLGWVEVTGAVAHPWHSGIAVLFWLFWGFYILEYVVKVAIAHDRLAYVRGHVLELVTAIFPFIGFLRAFKGVQGAPLNASNLAILKQRQLDKLAIITVQVIFIAAVIELILEQHANGSNITNWVDALYWSATTVTTVASQYAPVTTGGEIVSFLLMLYAVLVFTYFMSSLASALIGGSNTPDSGSQAGSKPGQQGTGQDQQTAGQEASASTTPAIGTNGATASLDGCTIHLTARQVEALRALLAEINRS